MPRGRKPAGGELFSAPAEDEKDIEVEGNGREEPDEPAPREEPAESARPFIPPSRLGGMARRRDEQRVEAEKDAAADELATAIAQWAIPGKKYSFDLMRLRPSSFKDEATGRTFSPGRDDGRGVFIQHYDEAPTLAEIEEVHGGMDYVLVAKGPDRDNPDRVTSKRFKVSILGAPKTLGMPTGAIPFAHVPMQAQPPGDNPVTQVTQSMMGMVRELMENSRKDMQTMISSLQQRPVAPAIDPAAQARLEEERAEKQRAHELAMKRMEMETLARQRADDASREEARIAREEARLERQRQHEKELAAMKTAEDARREEARERRAEADRITQMFQTAQKEQAAVMEKMINRLESAKQKEDPEERILRTIELVDRLRGGNEKEDEGGPLTKAIANALPEVLKSADKFLNKPAVPAAPRSPAIIAVDAPAALPAPVAPAPATGGGNTPAVEEQIPPFEWPAAEADMTAMAGLLGKNLELALQAGWNHKRIFDDVLMKFPESFLSMLRALPMEAIISSIKDNAPADAALRTNSGQLTMRLLYKALAKRGGA